MNKKSQITIVNHKTHMSLKQMLSELKDYKETLALWVWRDIKVRYSQSTLGIVWSLFPMLSQLLIYTLVFGKLVRIDSDGAPYTLFALVGIVPWIFFSQALNNISSSVYGAGQFIHKVYFPRMVLPIAALFDKMFDFFVAFVLLIIVVYIWQGHLSYETVLYSPLLIIILILNVLGIGMLAAAIAAQYRDILHIVSYTVTALMYGSPVVYPLSMVPESVKFYYGLNPMVGIIEGFRSIFLDTREMPWDFILISGLEGVFFIVVGAIYFSTVQSKFADVA